MAENPAAVWEYTLTGFNDFLEHRRIAFTEPIPASRVCRICGRLPSATVVLPCGDVFCELCLDEACDETKCPFDGRAFTGRQLVRLRFELSDLEQRRVVCILAGRQCPAFDGKLSELRDHMRSCRSIDVKCAKCNRPVARDAALDHYKQCIDGNAWRVSVYDLPVQRAVEEIRGVKEDLESLREQALGELDYDDDDLVNAANGLIERVASLDHSLSLAQEKASGFHRENALLDSSKSPAPGPYRSASKLGVFITTCEFNNVYAARNLLTQAKKEHRAVSEPHSLSGYTFRLDANFLLSGGEGNEEVSVSFSMYLKSGDWDDYVEWPFSRKVTVIIAHPRDATKDVRLPLRVDGYKVVRKPRPNNYNSGHKTGKKSWEDIELGGYIIKNTLYVQVEFE